MSHSAHVLLALSGEAHDLVGNRAGSPILLLMVEVKDSGSHQAPAIIEGSWSSRQEASQCTLAGVDVSQDTDLEVGELVLLSVSNDLALFLHSGGGDSCPIVQLPLSEFHLNFMIRKK